MIQGGGIELQLEDLVVDYIQNWTANVRLKVKRTKEDPSYSTAAEPEEFGIPAVHAGMLPKNEVGFVDVSILPVFPFVLCHITGGLDIFDPTRIDSANIYTKVICGVWDNNADYQGYRDCLSLLRRIIRKIWSEGTLGETYQLDINEGTKWRIYDSNEVTWPFFISEVTLCWRIRRPIAAYESEGLDLLDEAAIARQAIIPGQLTVPDTIERSAAYDL